MALLSVFELFRKILIPLHFFNLMSFCIKDTFSILCILLCSLNFVHIREIESRARRAEEMFDAANEKLHYTLIRNRDLEKELQEIVQSRKEFERRKPDEGEKKEEQKEEEAAEEKEVKEEKEFFKKEKEDKGGEEQEASMIGSSSKYLKKGKCHFLTLFYLGIFMKVCMEYKYVCMYVCTYRHTYVYYLFDKTGV
jgi:hypothetical protein